ncbi:F0F1 ATP synthase subunit B [Candidatus Proelusimicrobium excrementi]|uniref:F0F1 ATP synthase subunit B n=1 Tax=Candidatus Proelusimicrobium excrementi TaxID=3416222 RepID=UPI003CC03333|nr:F0F1 ATP synthase subunit B [Elusimicrobiaceae bacterium]
MDSLLKPDIGLMFWTIVNFLLLAFLLAKFAWKPLMNALDAREKQIAEDVAGAHKAREDAETIKKQVEKTLADTAMESSNRIKEASQAGEQQRQAIIAQAKDEAQNLINQAKAEIEAETQKAIEAVKKEVVDTTMLAARKVIGKEADKAANEKLIEDLLKDIKVK